MSLSTFRPFIKGVFFFQVLFTSSLCLVQTCLPFLASGIDKYASFTLPPYDVSPYISQKHFTSKACMLCSHYALDFGGNYMLNGINFWSHSLLSVWSLFIMQKYFEFQDLEGWICHKIRWQLQGVQLLNGLKYFEFIKIKWTFITKERNLSPKKAFIWNPKLKKSLNSLKLISRINLWTYL